jgi:hypothetical protein
MADALARMRAKRAARRLGEVTLTRSCEGCDLCCIAPGISEMGKPPGERCSNLCGAPGSSCSIYTSRPKVCIDFYCLWRVTEAILPDWLRPADCGFMLGFNRTDEWPGVITVHPDPARPLAWKNPWAMTVFATLAEKWNCLVAIGQSPGTTHIFCPNGIVIDLATYPPEERAKLSGDDGFIGAPAFVFGPDHRHLIEQMRGSRFVWDLMAPPWALDRAHPL